MTVGFWVFDFPFSLSSRLFLWLLAPDTRTARVDARSSSLERKKGSKIVKAELSCEAQLRNLNIICERVRETFRAAMKRYSWRASVFARGKNMKYFFHYSWDGVWFCLFSQRFILALIPHVLPQLCICIRQIRHEEVLHQHVYLYMCAGRGWGAKGQGQMEDERFMVLFPGESIVLRVERSMKEGKEREKCPQRTLLMKLGPEINHMSYISFFFSHSMIHHWTPKRPALHPFCDCMCHWGTYSSPTPSHVSLILDPMHSGELQSL